MSSNTEADKSAKLSEPKASPSPHRSPSSSSISKASHRQSFTENLRNPPASPRHRHPSLTHAAIQDLLIHPASTSRHQNSKFVGREWGDITIGELTSSDDVRWIDIGSSVEEATLMLLQSPTGVVLVREGAHAAVPIFCFDYNDLNAYLLTVVGVSRPEGDQATLFHDIMTKAQGGAHISLREIQPLCSREAIVKMNSGVNLSQAIETLGSGIHRVLVTDSTGNVIGIISQLRMVEFFWNEGVNFPTIDQLNPVTLQDLGIGVRPVLSVHSDAPLTEALSLILLREPLFDIGSYDSQAGGDKIASNVDRGVSTSVITSVNTRHADDDFTTLLVQRDGSGTCNGWCSLVGQAHRSCLVDRHSQHLRQIYGTASFRAVGTESTPPTQFEQLCPA
ncbi:hypothetical protein MKX07_004716 [Trichoderma sp. CBMAI-0711]|nr:hypothetical protein MKX07_004716 [Trichoderma sp. CBMAI-0711]